MAVSTIEKFIVALGFDFDPKDLTEFEKSIETVEKTIKGLTKTLVGATAAIFGLTVATTDAVDEQGKMAKQIGVSVEDLDAYETASSLAGDSAGAMANSLHQLSIRASEASRGMGTGIEAFGILGISATDTNGNLKDTIQLMLEVSGAMQNLDKAQQIELADKLGLTSSIRLLQQGPKAIKELVSGVKELGVTTEEDAALSAEFQDSLINIWKVIKQVSKTITRTFAPIMTDISDMFLDWWKTNQDIIKQNLPEWIEKATKVLKALTIVAGIFISVQLIGVISTLIKSFKGLSAIISLVNKKLLLIPSLIFTIVSAILLLAQDAKTFFEGGESYIGDFIKKFPEWRDQIELVAAAFATVWDIVLLVISGLKQLSDVIFNISFDGILETIKLLPGWFSSVIDQITGMFDEFILYLANKFPGLSNIILNIGAGLKAVFSTISTIITSVGEGIGVIAFLLSNLSFDSIKNFFTNLPEFAKSSILGLIEIFKRVSKTISDNFIESFKSIFSFLVEGLASAFSNVGSMIKDKIKNKFGSLFEKEEGDGLIEEGNTSENIIKGLNNTLDPNIPLVPPIQGLSTPNQLNNTNSTTNNNSNKTTNIDRIEITIDGAQEPAAVAQELQRQLQQASQDVNSGVYQ